MTETSEENLILTASNLTKVYNKSILALNNINVSLGHGITALIGPNGAGKSTFIKLIMGLLKPTKGFLKIFNQDSWDASDLLHENIGIIYEKHNFPGHLTVQDYINTIGNFFNSSDMLDIGSIINFPLDRTIDSLSAGMYRKLSLYICFLGKPRLIIMDEPTANLDPIARKEILDIIKHIHESFDIDFLISSHILSDLESIATNVIVFNKGHIRYYGKYSDLISIYFSNTFEIYVGNTKEWLEYLRSIDIVVKIKNEENKITFTIKNELNSNELLALLFNGEKYPKSSVNSFRKVLNIEEIFI